MVKLMQRYLQTAAVAIEKAYEDEDDGAAEMLKNMSISWTDDWTLISKDRTERDDLDLATYIYEGMSEIEDSCNKKGLPSIMSHIHESCYGLAASYDLQRYLMQGFFTHEYDVDALYELEWVHGCDFRFNGNKCFVFDLAKYKTYYDSQTS